MRISTIPKRATRAVIAAGALVATAALSGALPAAASEAQPVVTVAPSTHLVGGDTVQVTGTGLTPSASVQVVQCDIYDINDPYDNCPTVTTVNASGTGGVSLPLTLSDPVYRSQDIGNSVPIYCRSDICHIFLVWTDGGVQQVASSPALKFIGSPATITADPSQNLADQQRIVVSGTAQGAQGHTIKVVEESCYSLSFGQGCSGHLPAVTSRIKRDGSYSVTYEVNRFLADGTDCNNPDNVGLCEMNVIVLTHGQPDRSFGEWDIGWPYAYLTFQPSS